MQVADTRAEDSSESGSSREKALSSRSSSFSGSEGGALKASDGKGSNEDASIAQISVKRHVARKYAKKRVVGTIDSVSSDDADLQNGTRSLKEASADGRNKTELELNSGNENAEDSDEDASGEERLVEELKKTAKPRGRPPKNRVTLQSGETGDVELPKKPKPRGRPPKAKEHHSSEAYPESKLEDQEGMMEAWSSSEEGHTFKGEGLSDDKTANSALGEASLPLASPRRGRPPKAKSAKSGSKEETGKVARPRGRPPKPRDSQSGSENEPTKSPRPRGRPPKRKNSSSTASPRRGRPPKVRLVESSTEEEGTVVHARPRGRPPKASQEGTAFMSPKRGRPPKAKAKRGRPSKVSLAQSGFASQRIGRPPKGSESVGRTPKGSRRRGRPPKATLAAANTISPARPRGRPKKQPRPRGRPRKVPLSSSGTEGEQQATPRRGRPPKAKRKRGRPAKVRSADSDAEEKETKPPRPRGRPRKFIPTEIGKEESSEFEDPEFTVSSGRESSSTEREYVSGSEAGMKEEVEPKLIAGPRRGRPPKAEKSTTEQIAGQTKPAKSKGRPPKIKSMGSQGRGRPPKVRLTESGTEGVMKEEPSEPANSVTPRRGRPPKVKPSDSSMEEDGSEPTISVNPRRGRPPKAKQTKVSHDSDPAVTVCPKRGRPPKAKAVEISAEREASGKDHQDQMSASPGTGSMQTDEEDAMVNETSDGEETEEKEGVMIEVTGAESISDSVENEEVKTKAGRRGRPPKVKAIDSGIGESGGEQKKRGRPPKSKGPEEA